MSASESTPASVRAERDVAPACSVLYVEDGVAHTLLMHALFARLPGAQLTTAATGAAGLRAAIESTPQLLLLDLDLPDCRGIELLRRMRSLPGLARVAAVAVATEDSPELPHSSFKEVWMKPLDGHATLRRISALLHPANGPACATALVRGSAVDALEVTASGPVVTVPRIWLQPRGDALPPIRRIPALRGDATRLSAGATPRSALDIDIDESNLAA